MSSLRSFADIGAEMDAVIETVEQTNTREFWHVLALVTEFQETVARKSSGWKKNPHNTEWYPDGDDPNADEGE